MTFFFFFFFSIQVDYFGVWKGMIYMDLTDILSPELLIRGVVTGRGGNGGRTAAELSLMIMLKLSIVTSASIIWVPSAVG